MLQIRKPIAVLSLKLLLKRSKVLRMEESMPVVTRDYAGLELKAASLGQSKDFRCYTMVLVRIE